MPALSLECVGRAERRRRFGFLWLESRIAIQSGVALRLATALQKVASSRTPHYLVTLLFKIIRIPCFGLSDITGCSATT